METTKVATPLSPAISLFLILQLLAYVSTAEDRHGPPIVIPIPSSPCPSDVLKDINSLPLRFKMSSPRCARPWPLNVLFLVDRGPTEESYWSFILGVANYEGYVAVGSSPKGSMIGSSAIAGWISSSGEGVVKSYYLGGYNSSACVPGQGSLPLVLGSASIVSKNRTMFLGFQLNITVETNPRVIFAVGPPKRLPGPDFLLPMHYARTSSILL